VRRSYSDNKAAANACRQKNAFSIVLRIGGAAGNRKSAIKHIAFISAAANGDREIKVIIVGIATGASGSVRPGQSHAKRFRGVADKTGECSFLAGAGKF